MAADWTADEVYRKSYAPMQATRETGPECVMISGIGEVPMAVLPGAGFISVVREPQTWSKARDEGIPYCYHVPQGYVYIHVYADLAVVVEAARMRSPVYPRSETRRAWQRAHGLLLR